MSQENVEMVRGFLDAISRADYDHAAEYLHPEAEWRNTAAFPGANKVIGAAHIREFLRDLFEAYGGDRTDSSMVVEQIADAGEVVAVLVHGRGQGRSSGIPIDSRWAHTVRIRDSKVLRVDTYGQYARALEAAGLSE